MQHNVGTLNSMRISHQCWVILATLWYIFLEISLFCVTFIVSKLYYIWTISSTENFQHKHPFSHCGLESSYDGKIDKNEFSVLLYNNTHMTFLTHYWLLTHFLKLIQYFQQSLFQHNRSTGLSLPVFPALVCVSINCLYNIPLVYSYHFTEWKEHVFLLFLLLFPPPLILLPLYFMQQVILPVYA